MVQAPAARVPGADRLRAGCVPSLAACPVYSWSVALRKGSAEDLSEVASAAFQPQGGVSLHQSKGSLSCMSLQEPYTCCVPIPLPIAPPPPWLVSSCIYSPGTSYLLPSRMPHTNPCTYACSTRVQRHAPLAMCGVQRKEVQGQPAPQRAALALTLDLDPGSFSQAYSQLLAAGNQRLGLVQGFLQVRAGLPWMRHMLCMLGRSRVKAAAR